MKKIGCMFLILIMFVLILSFPKENNNYDYLRIHIRANSNLAVDQNVKYEIKDDVVQFLTPYFSEVKTKDQAVKIVNENISKIENICNQKLISKGFNYRANVKINNEYFPARSYENTTLNSGYYDAVIIELGEAVGDNWWCVMYPPLCFVNKNATNKQINYKSRIFEWFKTVFK